MSDHFRIEQNSVFHIIHCYIELVEEQIDELSNLVMHFSISPEPAVQRLTLVLDLHGKSLNELKFFRAMTPIGLQFKKQSRKFRIVGASSDFGATVQKHGLDGIFSVYPQLSDIQRPQKLVPRADATFLNSFIEATIKTIQVQCNVTIIPHGPSIKGNILDLPYDIAGVIGLTSNAFRGSIAICYPKTTFLALIGSMLGETYPEITQELEDGAAELLNIIFGLAKAELNEKHYEIEKAIPSIIRGDSLKINHIGSQPTIVIPFDSKIGSLRIEISLEAQELQKAA